MKKRRHRKIEAVIDALQAIVAIAVIIAAVCFAGYIIGGLL